MKRYLFLTSLLILSLPIMAQNLSSVSGLEKIINYRMRAVIKITVLDKNLKILTTGAGFFVGKKGEFLTSDHIIKEFQNNEKNLIQFKLYDGTYLDSVSLVACKNKNNIDACLLKDNSQKKRAYFPKNSIRIGKGHQVAMVGFCDKDSHSSKKGLIVDYFDDINSKFKTSKKAYNQKVKMVQTDVNQCPGDSGGPVFNYSGELIGMATNIFKSNSSQKQFNLSIHINELIDFSAKLKPKEVAPIRPQRILKMSQAKAKLLKLMK